MTVKDVLMRFVALAATKQSKIIEDCKEVTPIFCLYCEKYLPVHHRNAKKSSCICAGKM